MITRERFQNILELAGQIGGWEERPVTPSFADPQVHMSRSSDPQPFFLICEKDTIVLQFTGEADAHLRYSEMRRTRLEVGDALYVPAGTACRIEPREDSVHLRLKAIDPGLEGIAWFCASCDAEVWRYEFNAGTQPIQQGYLEGCEQFSSDESRRTCGSCQSVHPPVDLSRYRWTEVAEELRAETASQPA